MFTIAFIELILFTLGDFLIIFIRCWSLYPSFHAAWTTIASFVVSLMLPSCLPLSYQQVTPYLFHCYFNRISVLALGITLPHLPALFG